MLRYKACLESIVTLELLKDTMTNEKRKDVVNDKYAKFRCNMAKVISIVNVETGKNMKKDKSIRIGSFTYVLGEIVKTDFNANLNFVCAGGIHYFKTEEAALSWFYRQNENFPDGKCIIEWSENGQKECEGTYKDGKWVGKWIDWWNNGNKLSEGTYKDGKRNGNVKKWHYNGKIKSEGTYKNGLGEGKRETWYGNGNKESEGILKNGNRDGKWIYWHDNGDKYSEGTYKNGLKVGKWIHENYVRTYKDN